MNKDLNFDELKEKFSHFGQYERYLSSLIDKGHDTENIKEVVSKAITNIKDGHNSFIIYGEPQSGKTGMMIALTSKLLDDGFKTIIVLITNHIPLLNQNLFRFKNSGMNPSPRNYKEIMDEQNYPAEKPLVVFCKKDPRDLKKLIEKLATREKKVIIDDEADYATPNSKINFDEVSAINALTRKLISSGEGIYIGVTATPARLDLNNTHKNITSYWIEYKPHRNYVGQDIFFPVSLDREKLNFRLVILPDNSTQDALTEALFNFLISSAHLNIISGNKGYSMLIHTSGKRIDHSEDKKQIMTILNKLSNPDPNVSKDCYGKIWEAAKKLYPGEEQAIIDYIASNINRNETFLLNSDRDKNMDSNNIAVNPLSPFTIIFGGNIASRGVTFDRLLSMFFTRGVKKTFHQDTYIQRARMFGSRNDYLNHFELVIPDDLYSNWHSCFVYHRLSLQSVRSGNGPPVWIHSHKIRPTGGSSIDKSSVMSNSGEMGFEIFDYDETSIDSIMKENISNLEKLEKLSKKMGNKILPSFLLEFIKASSPEGEDSTAIRSPTDISGWDKETDKINISRQRNFISFSESVKKKYGKAIHHIQIVYNSATKKARIFYKYNVGSIGYYMNTKNFPNYQAVQNPEN